MKVDSPIRLESARAWRTYHGGRILDEMHGVTSASDTHFPEDWIISTVRAINAGREDVVEGLNVVSGTETTLKDAIAADPEAMMGAAHVAKWGGSPAVLVKLIDAAERLGVQGHPDKTAAQAFFGSPFGKTECWHIVGGRTIGGERPCVYMGFKPGITAAKWRDVFDRQDIPEMLGLLHRIEVKPGDTFLIAGGVPHAIGAGCLLMEIQEPTDYTFRTEKVTPQGFAISDRACHYGLGFDKMFECFHYKGYDLTETRRLRMVAPRVLEKDDGFCRTEIVGYGSTPCFALERLDVTGEIRLKDRAEGFFGLYVMAGRGEMDTACGKKALAPGNQFFVPAASRPFIIRAKSPLQVFLARSAVGRKEIQ